MRYAELHDSLRLHLPMCSENGLRQTRSVGAACNAGAIQIAPLTNSAECAGRAVRPRIQAVSPVVRCYRDIQMHLGTRCSSEIHFRWVEVHDWGSLWAGRRVLAAAQLIFAASSSSWKNLC